jgi:VWFA-related protein
MKERGLAILMIFLLAFSAFAQVSGQKPEGDQVIRISTELVQLDVVVTDKTGRVVTNLSKDDFELYEEGKKQQISFFEFVSAGKASPGTPSAANQQSAERQQVERQGATAAEVKRIFAFVVDDLTIRFEDLVYVRQMLLGFVDNQMQPTDLVAIVRTVGGRGQLQQFTADKDILRRAISMLTPSPHPFSAFNNPSSGSDDARRLVAQFIGANSETAGAGAFDSAGDPIDISSASDDANKTLRAYMSLGTASFIVDGLRQLPGRKSMILISGGLPIFGSQQGTTAGNVSYFLNQLVDKATRAGVAINTMDIRGLQSYSAVASFDDTPGRSALGLQGVNPAFGRTADESQLGNKNPFDQTSAHIGLQMLSESTGGIAVLNKNDFNEGLNKILSTSEGYYLLAYTPTDNKFKGDFRKVEIKVKGNDLKVYNRRGYMAREDKPVAAPATKQEQLLAAIRSPLARRDINLDTMLLYKAGQSNQGAIDINLLVDPKKLTFEPEGDKQQTDFEVAGFVFDEFGKLRGGFSETIKAGFLPDQLKRVNKGGFAYAATTNLPPGSYQVRIAVRDNKSGNIGTISRYVEVPDLTRGHLAASSLILGSVEANAVSSANMTPIGATRQISSKQDLRYAVVVYNAKMKDGKPQLQSQLAISQNGNTIYTEPKQPVQPTGSAAAQVLKVGQLGLSGVKPGRYTLTLTITDTLADKKQQTITRSQDFVIAD